ncbi:MAG: hypothetical protein JNN12_02020 [Bacteroidetes Order II. Incertae sedis bacterium]|nr:hypothetical protein [Bacteroidetes Order II. bacterium]
MEIRDEIAILDTIFSERNRAYGAYALRQIFPAHMRLAGLIVLLVSLFLSIVFFTHKWIYPPQINVTKQDVVAQLVTLPEPPSLPKPKVELLPKAPIGGPAGGGTPAPAVRPTIRFVPPVIRRDEEVQVEEPPPTIEELKPKVAATTTQKGDSTAVATSSGIGSGVGNGVGDGIGDGRGDGNGTGEGTGNGNNKPTQPDVRIAPKLVRIVTPEYTEAARSKRILAKVSVEVTIDETGKVTIARILKRWLLDKKGTETPIDRLEYGLEDAAMNAATRHLFRPARLNGKAIPSTYVLDMQFGVE